MQGPRYIKREAKVILKQTGIIETTDNEKYLSGDETFTSTNVINPVVDDFKHSEFNDPETGLTIRYNLFIPKNYNETKSYPMVLFMHDGTVTRLETKATLIQGAGAVVWATPEEQAKHECFVIAPVFDVEPVNDNSEAISLLDATIHLIKSLTNKYNIDKNRLYTTGQSGGCMMSIAMNIKYPDFLAASYLMAWQWDASLVAPMVNAKMWIVVSKGDFKAFPGMNAITDALEKAGAKVSRATWDGHASLDILNENAKKMLAEHSNIKYVSFVKGTLFPKGADTNGNEHLVTWIRAYDINVIRDWLFEQNKN